MIRWGIIGLGNMANTFAKAINEVPNSKLINIASQSKHKLDSFAKNLSHSYAHANKAGEPGLSIKNSTMMQMVEFTYQMAQMKNTQSESADDMLQEFLTKAYYFAQKRGQIYDFGPFGKLY